MNATKADFLDCTLDLTKDTFYPFKKPNNTLLYINSQSNHPPCIIKELPRMIEKRLSDLSRTANEFENHKKDYEKALKDNGHPHHLKYGPPAAKKRSRTRNVTYFNPPYNCSVTTNIGKNFLALLAKHFPKSNRYHKLFNKNTVKISYSCSPNLANIISSHNKSVIAKKEAVATPACNCTKTACPLDGKCRTSAVIYKATVKTTDPAKTKSYVGCAETDFKTRFYNHKSSFNIETHRSKTTLSQYVWKLREENEDFQLKWSLETQSKPYRCGTRKCNLCIDEKFAIFNSKPEETLNKRTEIANKCRHRSKFKLKNLK